MQAPKLAACQLLPDVAIWSVPFAGVLVSVKNNTRLCLHSKEFSNFSHSIPAALEGAGINNRYSPVIKARCLGRIFKVK